jgi:hypothetical protein
VIPAIALCALGLAAADADGSAARATGYLDLRGGWTLGWGSSAEAPPVAALYGPPALSLLTEGNVQLRLRLAEGADLVADVSFFVNADTGADGPLAGPLALGNLVVPSELYASLGLMPNLGVLVGRKRAVWGSGFAWNPSDLLDPPKDPTDPSFQRAGAWMIRAEAPFERFTATALWAPKVTAVQAGLPRRLLYEPGGSEPEQILAARVYALLADADVNVMWFWSNRYADDLPNSHRLAGSVSRTFGAWELHAEAIAQRGRDVPVADPACLPAPGGPPDPLLACAAAGRSPITRPFEGAEAIYARAIAGTRTTFADDSLLSVEYDYDGTGLGPAQWRDQQRLLAVLPALVALRPTLPPDVAARLPDPVSLLGGAEPGQPARFVFRQLRRHYLLAVFQKPRIADDFTASATAIWGLEDLSGLLAPGLAWSAREWLLLSLLAYVPFGGRDTEYGSLPFRFRAILEARAYY